MTGTPSTAGLRLSDLDVGYRRRTIMSGIEARAERGELTILIGPNGAGKSTLLRTLAGLRPALGGTVTLNGEDLLAGPPQVRARKVAVVLTDRVEAGLLTGRELVALGRHPHTGVTGSLRPADRDAVDRAIDAVRAGPIADRRVTELSDGERQRLLIARALTQESALLLLDEPGAFLDVSARVALLGLLRRLAREQDRCVVMSTHDLELALRVTDHVWLIGRDSDLTEGPPHELIGGGGIGAVFDTDELVFDPATATFVLTQG